MASVDPAGDSGYGEVQSSLFRQILTTVQRAMAVLVAMGVIALLFPSLRILPVVLLGLIPFFEGVVTLICDWLIRRREGRKGAWFFVLCSLFLSWLAGAVMGLSVFAALCAAVLVTISAVLLGYRSVVLPAVIGFFGFLILHLSADAAWLRALQFKQASASTVILQIGFVAAVLGIMSGVSWISSERLQRANQEVLLRAHQSDQARVDQSALNERLTEQIREQERLLGVIQELEIPTIPVRPGVVVLPLVGALDARRLAMIEERLLQRIHADRIQVVLVDLTGIPQIDEQGAEGLRRLAMSVQILGARIVLTGMQPAAARLIVALGKQSGFQTIAATIADALETVGHAA